MRLTTPDTYVDEYGIVETGRLLTNKSVIDPATNDDRASYITAMFEGGVESGGLKATIVTELNRYIDSAQAEIVPRIRRFLVWPLSFEGFTLSTDDVPAELARITREVARYYLHDEDTRTVEEVSFIERRYRNALTLADRIGAGEYRLSDVDSNFEDQIVYTI